MPKSTKRPAGVMFDPDVLAFLSELAGNEGKSRSWLINYIIRHYAQQQAAKLKVAPQRQDSTVSF